MKINNLEVFLEKAWGGRMPLGCCITFSDPAVTEVACASGFDFVWIDGEHGELDRNTAMLHLMAVKGTGVAALYRVPACDHTEIKRIIDFAPAGVIVPMVMDEQDAALAVSACRYPCHGGDRGCGYRRGWDYGAGDTDAYLAASAHDPLVILQLEHIDAAKRLDAILAVPGIDSVLVGPYDFSMSMGKPGQFDDPEVKAALDEACAKVKAKGILLGAYAESHFEDWRRRGVDYMGVKNDTNAMLAGFRSAQAEARSGLGVASRAVKGLALAFALAASAVLTARAEASQPVDWVRPEIGTDFNGHVNPGATYPFGMLQPGPDTGKEGWDYCGGYRWQDKEIIGFTQTHLFGTGCSDLGDYRLMPYVGARRTGEPFPGDFKSDYRKETEVRQCGYYAVSLDRNGVRVETTVAPHAAIYRFTALKDGPLHVVFDDYFGLNGKMNEQIRAATLTLGADRRSLRGTKTRKNWVERTTSFVLEFDRPWTSSSELAKVVPDQVPKRYDFTFDAKRGDVLTVKFALSFVSEDGAEANLRREIPAWDFDAVRASARAAWNQVLSRAKVRGPAADCEKFYTSLYHAFVQPVNIADVDGRYRGADDKVAVAPGGTYYSTFSFWDTYRAAHPLYTVLAPERVPGMVASIVAHGKAAGFLPIWTLCGKDNQCMIGTHSIPVLVDAVRKGLAAGTDEREAMRLVRDTLTRRHPGRVKEHWDELERYGYYPFDRVYPESVSRLVEVAFDDWCAAQLATRVGDAESARHFARRAENWKNVVDPETGLLRGRDSKGNWRTPFSPFALGRWGDPNNDYTEGNAWQWTWHVLHDPLGLVRALGGRDQALRKLDALFVQPEKTADSGECGDVTGLIGQYAHGNEPSHHVAYLYRYLGRPDRTAEVVREICTKLYTNRPDGICGNEDCGQMSAWYVFSALGFYPFNPASGEYVLGAPQVEEAVLDVGGKTFVVRAKGLSERAKYVKSVTLNGRPLAGFTLTHDQLRVGGELVFEMRE